MMAHRPSSYSTNTVKRSDDVDMSPHKLLAANHLTPIGRRLFKFVEFDDDEELFAEIRKHPIGVIFRIVGGVCVGVVFLLTSIIVATNLNRLMSGGDTGADVISVADHSNLKAIILLVGFALVIASVIVTAISVFLYRSDVVFVTNEKIAEVSYISLFNRRTTQMSIGNIEDVTVSQNGILAQAFNFGSVHVETAGEMSSPAYTFVPFPNQAAKVIVKAHENSVKRYGN